MSLSLRWYINVLETVLSFRRIFESQYIHCITALDTSNFQINVPWTFMISSEPNF